MTEDIGKSTTWAPSMDGIRNAHLAEANALETILAALASKQQESMTALRREVEKIAAEQTKLAAARRGRNLKEPLGSLNEAAQAEDGASSGKRSDRVINSEAGGSDAVEKMSRVNNSMVECPNQVAGTAETATSDTDKDEQLEEDRGQFEGMQYRSLEHCRCTE